MGLVDDLLAVVQDAEVVETCQGNHWTGVWVRDAAGQERCGLATTLRSAGSIANDVGPAVADEDWHGMRRGRAVAELALTSGAQRSLGFAAIHALVPLQPARWSAANAKAVLLDRCAGRRVALVGRFGFAAAIRACASSLTVLEQDPHEGELPAEHARGVLPSSDWIVITGMALVNHTLEALLALCPSGSHVALVGPSVPLSDVLFDHGLDLLCGAYVEQIPPVMAGIRRGADFHQVHRLGARLVTLER
jgi:uncharacterized protein (DUF4213/DUF364 family)